MVKSIAGRCIVDRAMQPGCTESLQRKQQHLKVLAHADADVLGQFQGRVIGHAADEQAACCRQVEGVVRCLVRHDAHVRLGGVPLEVHLRNISSPTSVWQQAEDRLRLVHAK